MADLVKVSINGTVKEYEKGTRYEVISREYQEEYENLIALVKVNGEIRELCKTVTKDCDLSFITLREDIGKNTYFRTAVLLLVKAVQDIVGSQKLNKVKVEFAIGQGYYCSVAGDVTVDDAFAEAVARKMRTYVEANLSISKTSYATKDAISIFEQDGMKDKVNLFKYRRSSTVNVYEMAGYHDYFYGYMLPSAGYVKYFNVECHEGGLMLLLPTKAEPKVVPPYECRKQLFDTLMMATDWGEKMDISTVGDLNNAIVAGKAEELILIQEAFQERRVAEIAHEIAQRGGVKFVMIAGPSSSGKTTFSHRLSIQLATHGLKPHPIGIDDYYKNRDECPKDSDGNYDFECLEAIDVEQFNKDMMDLLNGKTVEIPSYNFKLGKREYKGNYKTLGPDDILVIEGIHGLNDRMSYSLPTESKYKIYISCLTSLNIDEHNRIPTTDSRLLRRMVRDARTRGTGAKGTISMWPSVRRGEENYIFPFQESADAMYNSASIYELAALKQFAEPLLLSISEDEPEYYEAKRLLKFLDYFLGITTERIPINSIVREFVGGSCFNV